MKVHSYKTLCDVWILSLLCFSCVSHAAEFHVAVNGDDSNLGTLEAPFRTIRKATAVMQSGDRCLIHAGAGGVGRLLIQMARSAGAEVFTTVSTLEKARLAREAEAQELAGEIVVDDTTADRISRIKPPDRSSDPFERFPVTEWDRYEIEEFIGSTWLAGCQRVEGGQLLGQHDRVMEHRDDDVADELDPIRHGGGGRQGRGQLVAAGGAADALTLFEKFEGHLERYRGNLRRATVGHEIDVSFRQLDGFRMAHDHDGRTGHEVRNRTHSFHEDGAPFGIAQFRGFFHGLFGFFTFPDFVS